MKNRSQRWNLPQRVSGAVLLVILAVSGYIAMNSDQTEMVSVPVLVEMIDSETVTMKSTDETRRILNEQREREISLLDEVILQGDKDPETAEAALEQKLRIAERMELEAQTQAALSHLGYEHAAVVCGAQSVSVFVPYAYVEESKERIRILDCVCMQTQLSPENIKIILSKNE